MNMPNKLTVIRMCLVPVIVACLLISFKFNLIVALVIFSTAAVTDLIDGKLARKHGIVTDFGKFLDPLADKLLVSSVFICFIELNLISAIAVVIVVAREFFVTSIRLIAMSKGDVIAAATLGKVKMVSQIVVVCYILVIEIANGLFPVPQFLYIYAQYIGYVLVAIMVVLTVVSGYEYFIKNKKSFLHDR